MQYFYALPNEFASILMQTKLQFKYPQDKYIVYNVQIKKDHDYE